MIARYEQSVAEASKREEEAAAKQAAAELAAKQAEAEAVAAKQAAAEAAIRKREEEAAAKQAEAEAVTAKRAAAEAAGKQVQVEAAAAKKAAAEAAAKQVEAKAMAAKKTAAEAAAKQAEAKAMAAKKTAAEAAMINVPAKSGSQPLGYAIFAIIENNTITNPYFDIVGKPRALFPTRNDIITPNRAKVSLRAVPYHWDANNGRNFDPTEDSPNIESGQKAKVAADVFIATEGNKQYAIAPISKVLNTNIQKLGPPFYPNTSGKIRGYVYVGLIDEKTGKYKKRMFENETSHNAIYPSPNDILVAMTDVNLRAGPRKWDAVKKDYENATTVQRNGQADMGQLIKKGQRVKVGGDTVLATGGLSIWAPISKILSASE